MNQIHDVAIIGAGIAGNALAKSLADRGWNTVLFERKTFPRHKVCGEFMSPESRSMLNDLGVSDLVESLQPSLINRTRLIFSYGDPLEIPLPGSAIGVSRYSLDSALLSAAQSSGVQVMTATTVISVTPSDRGYLIETKQGKDIVMHEVRAVIAAWGMNGSSALKASLSHAPKRPSRMISKHTYVGVKSHFQGIEMDDSVELYFFEGGYLGLSPVEGGLVNVAALMKRSAFQNTPKSITEWIEAACNRNPKLQQKLSKAAIVDGTQAAVAPVDLNRKPSAWDLFPQVGDAAVMIPPLCGDGMSMALRSAKLCAPLADSYLKGEISLVAWQKKYSSSIDREFTGPRQWGLFLQSLLSVPLLPRLLMPAARLTPKLTYGLVQATRLKESDS